MNFLSNASLLITGGTGSFGRSFTRYLLQRAPIKRLAILSRDEYKQYAMQQEMDDARLRFFVGDVRDLQRLQRAFHNVDIVIHAAALKQVPAMEYNPFEAIKTNIYGTQNVIEAAIDNGVKKVLLISTDKAVEAANLYGATKLCAERLFMSGNFYSAGRTALSVVRYGNVLGSRGSVVELLHQKRREKSVPITDPEMTRFCITLQQSFALVLFALAQMEGGELFVPKLPSVLLTDIFEAIVPHAKMKVIGLRPGEKLHEVLITREEARRGFELKDHYVILPDYTTTAMRKKYEKYQRQGKPLPKDFYYTSVNNTRWVTKAQLKSLTKEFGQNYV